MGIDGDEIGKARNGLNFVYEESELHHRVQHLLINKYIYISAKYVMVLYTIIEIFRFWPIKSQKSFPFVPSPDFWSRKCVHRALTGIEGGCPPPPPSLLRMVNVLRSLK